MLHDDDPSENIDAQLAGDLALIEPYLMREIVRVASVPQYIGAAGAAKFLIQLPNGEVSANELFQEALDKRVSALGHDRSLWPTPTKTHTNLPASKEAYTKKP